MKRTILIASLVLAACEGEPPKTPAGQLELVAPPSAEEEPSAEATPPAGAAPGVALCPCACNCAGGATASADGGAGALDGAAPAVVEAPPAVTKGNITGSITTMPREQARNAVVYLEDAPIEPTAKMSVTIDNHMMTFTPFVAVIPTGGKVAFHNSDPFPHNVFSPDNEKFDMGVVPQNQARARTFKSPGRYTVLCNLHPGMIGYIVVTPSSYFAKSDAKGHYTLKDVPNGVYKISAWAPRQQVVTQTVTVKGGDAVLDFELHR